MKYRFEIPVRPTTKKNGRPIFKNKKTGKHFLGKTKAKREYEEGAIKILKGQLAESGLKEPLTGRIRATLYFDFTRVCMADMDNLMNMAYDCAEKAGILSNDRLVKQARIKIRDDGEALVDRTVMIFEPIDKEKKKAFKNAVGLLKNLSN